MNEFSSIPSESEIRETAPVGWGEIEGGPEMDVAENRDDLIGFISDTYKEIYGMRPRPIWREISDIQLKIWADDLTQAAKREREENVKRERIARKLRHAEQKAWEEKKKTYFFPVKFNFGLFFN